MQIPNRSFSDSVFRKISTENVLSKENKEECIARLRNMKSIDIRTTKSSESKNAAVLVPLCVFEGSPSLLYIIRSRSLKVNKGQAAFPGGMEDKSDLNLKETALRETYEEIGFPTSKVDVWMNAPSLGRDNLLITPYLGFLGQVEMNMFKINKSEVSDIFILPLDHLCDPRYFRTTQFRPKESVGYKLPVYLGGPEKIWGVTALLTHVVLTALVPKFYRNAIRYRPMISTRLQSRKNSSNHFLKE